MVNVKGIRYLYASLEKHPNVHTMVNFLQPTIARWRLKLSAGITVCFDNGVQDLDSCYSSNQVTEDLFSVVNNQGDVPLVREKYSLAVRYHFSHVAPHPDRNSSINFSMPELNLY